MPRTAKKKPIYHVSNPNYMGDMTFSTLGAALRYVRSAMSAGAELTMTIWVENVK